MNSVYGLVTVYKKACQKVSAENAGLHHTTTQAKMYSFVQICKLPPFSLKRGYLLKHVIYISSLDPDVVSAEEFQEIILGHLEVENCLHLIKDRDSGEDKHVCGSDWGGVDGLVKHGVVVGAVVAEGRANVA